MRDKIKLSEVADLIMGQSPDSNFCGPKEVGLPFLQGCAEFGKLFPIVGNYCSKPKKVSPKNSILISVRAPVGKMNLANQDFTIGRGLAGIVAKNIDKEFLYYSVFQFRNQLERLSQGSTFKAINSSDLQNFRINYFEKSEQQQIAQILSTCDTVLEKTEAAIAKYKAIKQGLLHDLFTRGIDPTTGELRPSFEDAPELYKETELGFVPREWKIKMLGDLGKFSKGTSISKSKLTHEGVSCILYGQLYTKYEDALYKAESFVNRMEVDSNKKLNYGDILFAGSGETHEEIGKNVAILVEDEIYAGGDIVILKPLEEIDSFLFSHLLNHDTFQKQKSKMGQGSSVIHIYASHLEQIIIPVMSLKEQMIIGEKIKSLDQKIESEQRSFIKYQAVKAGLMQDLLSGVVGVEALIKNT